MLKLDRLPERTPVKMPIQVSPALHAELQDYAERLMRVLDAFGFGSVGLVAKDFLTPNRTIQLGYPPNRIDLLTSLKAVDFAACYAAKVTTELEGVTVDFIDLANLTRNKRAVGRHEDLADLDNLE